MKNSAPPDSDPRSAPLDHRAAPDPTEILTLARAAERLHCRSSKLYALIRAGELPTVTIGRTRFITAVDLAAYLANLPRDYAPARTPNPTPAPTDTATLRSVTAGASPRTPDHVPDRSPEDP